MSETLDPRYSRATAYSLWKEGKMPDSYYIPNYMTPEEAWEYHRQKIREETERILAEKAWQKQMEKEFEKNIAPKIEKTITDLLKGLSIK